MSIALYRKYRPKSFLEVVSQNHVKTTLINAIEMANIGHAYIFVGARGIGKTTLARIFAKAVNCRDRSKAEPCNECENCNEINEGKALDLIEIDAASNRGIEEIRELREKVKFTPSRMKYKVFIIDEVHMLTKEAFNALLKTLEEPPEHAIFLLATTEVHKVPATILSRCQRFDLKKLTVPELVRNLKTISKAEGIKISEEALELISSESDGCARDAVSLMTQLIAFSKGEITQELVKDVLGVTDLSSVSEFVDHIIQKNTGDAIDLLGSLTNEGFDLEQFTKNVVEYFRKMLILKVGAGKNDVVISDLSAEQLQKLKEQSRRFDISALTIFIKKFLSARQDLKKAVYPQLPLEIVLVEMLSCEVSDVLQVEKLKGLNAKKVEPEIIGKKIVSKKFVAVEKKISKVDSRGSAVLDLKEIISKWKEVIDRIAPQNHSISAFLQMGVPEAVSGEYLALAFKFRFHKEKIAEHKYRRIVENAMEKVYGKKILLRCVVDENFDKKKSKLSAIPKAAVKNVAKVKDAGKTMVDLARQVFGG